MPNNSMTEAGRSEAAEQPNKLALVDAINQVFTLFRLNYHNQYLKAFGKTEELNEVKRLWMEMLQRFSPRDILQAAKTVIENSEYLPTLHTMIHAAERASQHKPIPDAHSAYIEACRASSPKVDFAWSHPLVYYAGKRSDWYFLQSSAEAQAYPVFKKHYEELLMELRAGKTFPEPTKTALPHSEPPALEKTLNRANLKALRNKLDI